MAFSVCVAVVIVCTLCALTLPAEAAALPSVAEICTERNNRPPRQQRLFVSDAVESALLETCLRLNDPALALLFVDCFPNTLDTTVVSSSSNDTFIITGDIYAMWLRDSSWQVYPYFPYVSVDPHLRSLMQGLVRRQMRSVLMDCYANAFNPNNDSNGWQSDQRTPPMTPGVFEGKWEVDSLCSVIHTSYLYWNHTQDASLFDEQWKEAMDLIVDTFVYQQHTTEYEIENKPKYSFARTTTEPTDTLMHGVGTPTNEGTGLIKSAFRASDDATVFQFNIPENAFAAVSLRQLSTLMSTLGDSERAGRALALAEEVEGGIRSFGIWEENGERMYSYEVDGFGNHYFMDDANVPSLLSLPFLGFVPQDDSIYHNTRKRLLSRRNPFYSAGTAGYGIGGPHVGQGWIWPLSIIMRALTSQDKTEISSCLEMLKTTSVGTGFMHESFWQNNASSFTRPWFAWANTMFGHLIMELSKTYPDLIFSNSS